MWLAYHGLVVTAGARITTRPAIVKLFVAHHALQIHPCGAIWNPSLNMFPAYFPTTPQLGIFPLGCGSPGLLRDVCRVALSATPTAQG